MKRVVVVAAAPLVVGACSQELEILLRVQVAEGLDGVVDFANDGQNLTVLPTGESGHDIDEPFTFPDDFARLGFELVDIASGGVPVGIGRTVVDAPDEDDARVFAGQLRPTILLGAIGGVTLLQGVPPVPVPCATSDERGHVFVIGGRGSPQTGYGLNDDYSMVALPDGDNALANAVLAGCSAVGGRVVGVGCAGEPEVANGMFLVDASISDAVTIAVGGDCALPTFGARRDDTSYWVLDGQTLRIVDRTGSELTATTLELGAVTAVEANADGEIVVLTSDGDAFTVDDDPLSGALLGENIGAIGRRGADIVAIDADGTLFKLSGDRLDVVSETGIDDARAIAVLSTGEAVALVGDDLVFERGGVDVTVAERRTRLSVLPGDSIVLSGGDVGVDVFALAAHEPLLDP